MTAIHGDREDGSSAARLQQHASESDPLPDLLRESLRRVITEQHNGESDEATLRTALRDVCERARCDSVRVERLLVVLKECWRALPERAELPRHHADDALASLVSACIEEYYKDQKRSDTVGILRRIHGAGRSPGRPAAGEIQ
jgi:hypothetical protein